MLDVVDRQRATAQHTGEKPRVIVLKTFYQFMKNYNYLVVDPSGRQAVIVDPAWQMGKIVEAVMDTQARLSGILITHSHPDHVDLANPIAERFDCPIWMSHEEIEASDFDGSRLIALDKSPLAIGQMLIEYIVTPGHTPGSVCYLIGDNLFTGDVLFAEGCGMCPDTRAAHDMFASLENLKSRLKPQTRIFPGHSYGKAPGRFLAQLLQENIYLQFPNKHSFAAFRLRPGQDRAKMFNFV